MTLDGLHHITMVTGGAPAIVDFYAETLGLRLVKKTVNFDSPDAYHLYFGDEHGSPGSILTWFEFPGAARGRAGAGMIHTIELGVADEAALDFWAQRLGGRVTRRDEGRLSFADADGLAYDLVIAAAGSAPLRAEHPEIPAEHAIAGIEGARAYASSADAGLLTETLGFTAVASEGFLIAGERRSVAWRYDAPPAAPGRLGAGTVHHIAWASRDADHLGWRDRVAAAGVAVTDIRNRDYFRSIYFHEPHGVLFEIATLGPGFAIDEAPERLGEELRLPAMHEHLRARLERSLVPLVNPRAARRAEVRA